MISPQIHIHIHIMRYRLEQKIYQASREQVEDALSRHPEVSDKVVFSFSEVERYKPEDWLPNDFDSYYKEIADADVLYGYTFTRDAATRAPKLKWIQSASSGVEQLSPFDWIPDDVFLTNSRGIHQAKSGESFAMYLGMLNSKIPEIFTNQCQNKWARIFTSIIKGRVLIVVGIGNQGGEMARQAKNQGMKVIGIDPYVKEHPFCDEITGFDGIEEAFRSADIVALTAPLTKETYRFVGERELSWMPKGSAIINVARGPLLDSDALIKKLETGHISGAILDVFDETPLPQGSPLWQAPNLFISPHVSSDDPINYTPLCLDILLRNVANYFCKRPLENIVNTKAEF